MCSSYRSIADRVECCMDDLIECFEDYITKSLIAITVALGIIVASVVYLLKAISEHTLGRTDSDTDVGIRGSENRNARSRRQGRLNRDDRRVRQDRENRQERYDRDEKYDRDEREERYEKQGRRKGETHSQSRRGMVNENYLMLGDKDQPMSTVNTNKARSVPSFDESVLREVGLSCCPKPCCLAKRKSQNKNLAKEKSENISKDQSRPDETFAKENLSVGQSLGENIYKRKSQNENLTKGRSEKSQNDNIIKGRLEKDNVYRQKSPDASLSTQRTADESLSLQKTPDESLSTQKSPDESLSIRRSQYESLNARRSQYDGLATGRSEYDSMSRHQASHQYSEPIPQRPYDVVRPRSRYSIPVVPRSMNSPRHSLQSLRICPASNRASCCSMCKKDSRHCR